MPHIDGEGETPDDLVPNCGGYRCRGTGSRLTRRTLVMLDHPWCTRPGGYPSVTRRAPNIGSKGNAGPPFWFCQASWRWGGPIGGGVSWSPVLRGERPRVSERSSTTPGSPRPPGERGAIRAFQQVHALRRKRVAHQHAGEVVGTVGGQRLTGCHNQPKVSGPSPTDRCLCCSPLDRVVGPDSSSA